MDSIKREYPRKSKKIKGMINIHINDSTMEALSPGIKDETIKIIAETKDISWGGFCLQMTNLPRDRGKRFTPEKAHTIVGRQIVVSFNNPHLTLWGEVIRLDSKAHEMAITITKVSDYDLWQGLCDAQEQG
ncbi:MAG TPA: hypothetical protein ENN05_11730 [Deltaproteobacteria bacterium]|nr:hypothetical protein [Deltaproteobacteria bacterium]